MPASIEKAMTSTTDLSERLSVLVRAHLPPDSRSHPLQADDDLFAAGLDSLAVASLVIALEQSLGLELPAERITPHAFSSLRAIEESVRDLLSARA